MLRSLLSSLTVLGLCVALTMAADDKSRTDKTNADKTATEKTDKHHKEAKIVKVDQKKGTVTLRFKDKTGKEMEKTFKLAEDIRYMDSTGRVAAIDVFTAGDYVLFIEREGKIHEMKKKNKEGTTGKTETTKKPGGSK